jgi:hypothetical protein
MISKGLPHTIYRQDKNKTRELHNNVRHDKNQTEERKNAYKSTTARTSSVKRAFKRGRSGICTNTKRGFPRES